MLSIVYVSNAIAPFTDDQLNDLLAHSRTANTARGLSGLLLYKEGQFMQALEGPDEAVRERYEVIAADPRHESIRILAETPIEARQFGEWAMGFRSVNDSAIRNIPGYHSFFEGAKVETGLWDTPSRARLLLEWFRHRSV